MGMAAAGDVLHLASAAICTCITVAFGDDARGAGRAPDEVSKER